MFFKLSFNFGIFASVGSMLFLWCHPWGGGGRGCYNPPQPRLWMALCQQPILHQPEPVVLLIPRFFAWVHLKEALRGYVYTNLNLTFSCSPCSTDLLLCSPCSNDLLLCSPCSNDLLLCSHCSTDLLLCSHCSNDLLLCSHCSNDLLLWSPCSNDLLLCSPCSRAGNWLIGFPSELLVFCSKMSEWAIC